MLARSRRQRRSVRIAPRSCDALEVSSEREADTSLVKKEKEKAEKQRKFEEKVAKQKAAAPVSAKAKEKKEKPKDEVVAADYVEETPKGQKKSELLAK